MRQVILHIKRMIRSFTGNEDGASVVMVAVAMVPMLGMAGLAVDTTRAYMLKSQLSYALDAAGLAGGKELFSDDLNRTINTVFKANFPDSYMNAQMLSFNPVVDAQGESLTITASVRIETTFLKVIGQDEITVAASTTIQRAVRGMELALVLDTTGSMRNNNKIGALKTAATDLVNILFGDNETVDDFWVSLVPFTSTVNPGADRFGWVDNHSASDFPGTSWKGCVVARDAPNDQNDATPAESMFQTFVAPSRSYNYNDYERFGTRESNDYPRTPNKNCGHEITSLTDSKSKVQAGIDALTYWRGGGTMGNIGLVWGWRTLSPKWRGLWGDDTPAAQPFDYDEPLMDKVVVMLTDGRNEWVSTDYTAYGELGDERLGTSSQSAATTIVNQRMANICEAMKDEGIRIFTIIFQLNDAATEQLYRNCASQADYYFNSPDNETLQQAFRKIGSELSNLRIAE
ncbi:TadE/TadG family type IV pilus assembly protein [Kiloniella sp. b19]|uniref:TadE/TadG family type IV pilus assembly protein n=1 Tax=Kiloniella sp. GXU_MW_B19 TaxID=3141326 RepID=UPI0031D364BC